MPRTLSATAAIALFATAAAAGDPHFIEEVDVQGALGIDFSLIAGVEVRNGADPTKNSFYDLKVTVDESGSFQTDDSSNAIVTHERSALDEAVVKTFADGVVKRLY